MTDCTTCATPSRVPVLTGTRVRLRPLSAADAGPMYDAVRDPEVRRLTGTHRAFTYEQILAYVTSREAQTDRYDWAVEVDGEYLGDVALNEIDTDDETAGFRIALGRRLGEGLGTEATRLMLDFAFGTLKLYRVELEVFDFNPRARRSYEKNGFVVEGVKSGALKYDGERHDVLLMAAVNPGMDA